MSTATLEQRIPALEDRNAIVELAATYNRGVDSYDEALWMTVWHEGAEPWTLKPDERFVLDA